jgi:hypothetical protein
MVGCTHPTNFETGVPQGACNLPVFSFGYVGRNSPRLAAAHLPGSVDHIHPAKEGHLV